MGISVLDITSLDILVAYYLMYIDIVIMSARLRRQDLRALRFDRRHILELRLLVERTRS